MSDLYRATAHAADAAIEMARKLDLDPTISTFEKQKLISDEFHSWLSEEMNEYVKARAAGKGEADEMSEQLPPF